MKRRAHIRICFFIGIALSASAGVSASDTLGMPYREIASRNSFGLKALERPDSPKPPVVSRPKIQLAGITTILARKIAFLIVTASEPGRSRECLVLGEGQRQHEIEVAEIDEKHGTVKVLNRDREEILLFVDGGESPAPQ